MFLRLRAHVVMSATQRMRPVGDAGWTAYPRICWMAGHARQREFKARSAAMRALARQVRSGNGLPNGGSRRADSLLL